MNVEMAGWRRDAIGEEVRDETIVVVQRRRRNIIIAVLVALVVIAAVLFVLVGPGRE